MVTVAAFERRIECWLLADLYDVVKLADGFGTASEFFFIMHNNCPRLHVLTTNIFVILNSIINDVLFCLVIAEDGQ